MRGSGHLGSNNVALVYPVFNEIAAVGRLRVEWLRTRGGLMLGADLVLYTEDHRITGVLQTGTSA